MHTSTTLVCVPLMPDYPVAVLPAWLATNYAIGIPYRPTLCSKLLISSSSSHPALAPLSSLTTPVITPRSSNFLPLMRPQMRAPQPVSNKSPTFPCPHYSPTNLTPARSTAAEGYLSTFTIPLLADPETLVQTARLNWVLRFPRRGVQPVLYSRWMPFCSSWKDSAATIWCN